MQISRGRNIQAWANEILDEHQLSEEAGTTWSQGSLPAQGLWKRFFECFAEGRWSRKPERKQNLAVEGLTEAGGVDRGWCHGSRVEVGGDMKIHKETGFVNSQSRAA